MIRDLFFTDAQEDSNNYYQALRAWKIDPDQDFLRVKSRIGLWPSQTYAQMYFAEKMQFKRLRRELELHHKESNASNQEYDVLIVLPPHGALPKATTQKFLRQCMGLCTVGQFAYVTHAQINSNRVVTGAKRLSRMINEKRKSGRKLLIVSYSYGSAFVRVMMDRMSDEEKTPIKGWLNISGLLFGSPRYHCSDRMTLLNNPSGWQRSFSSEQSYFLQPFNPGKIKTVHMLGLLNGSGLSYRQRRRREALKAWGPGDGIISFAPYQRLNQPLFPVFDQGHQINLQPLASSFVRILSSMVSTVPVPKRIMQQAPLRSYEIL